jgi:hypothetical protein
MNQNKVIGNGMISKCLVGVNFGQPTLILASGVSDSQETRPEAFEREFSVVKHAMDSHPSLHVIYCSTCSVDSGIQTPYIKHKLAMEDLVLSRANTSHIFRLPQVVGRVHNRTLISYIVESILKDRLLRVQTQATRNLLDVRDFARVASLMVRGNIGVCTPQNIASSTQIPVNDIVVEIAKVLNAPTRIEFVDAGYSQLINIAHLNDFLPALDPLFDTDYWRSVVQYYAPLIAADIADDIIKN